MVRLKGFLYSGVTFPGRGGAVLILPILAAYFAYRSVASAVFAQVLHQANAAYWQLKLGAFARNKVTELFEHPTPFATEAILANLAGGTLKKLATGWLFAIVAVICIGPLGWFAVASVQMWTQPLHFAIRLTGLVTLWLFAARGCVLIAHFFVLLYQELKDALKDSNPEALAKLESIEIALRETFARRSPAQSA